MDLLKQELLKKRQTLAQDTGGKKFFKRSEIQQKEIQKLREQEKRELEAKSQRQSSSSSITTSTSTTTPNSSAAASTTTTTINNSTSSATTSKAPNRRTKYRQPHEDARLDRLKVEEEAEEWDCEWEEEEGQRGWRRWGRMEREGKGMESLVVSVGLVGGDNDLDSKRMKANLEELCEEDKILVFFKRLLNEWNEELDEMPEAEKRTAKGKSMVATFKQCARYLNPLFDFSRKKILPSDIRLGLLLMVECCMKRDYLAAMDHYIRLAIGNAPWPIGVTMVGIHERSAREKIYTNSVAHIMNDETTRKYLQSVKRLMTFCQRRYPTMPSKAVEFNSLANGSDLQSLLAEERGFDGNQPSEGRLRLMPAPDEN
ncbi:hypothetical protein OIU79_017346 [Salix purpurea]|uniref:Pre-mRNA-splicing factor 18 n=1 Tax=Salix purpurea TaxID=77065 RepID=A0A9Q0WXB5_SALPP|nr:hypothetical protein OIU79_017346 [Salix purpurea]